MVITLVVATFILLVVHDYILQRRHTRLLGVKGQAPKLHEKVSSFSAMNIVGGFNTPSNLAYHSGHGWAAKESRQVVRVGIDDFASRIIGQIDQIDLPARGHWLRQGEHGWTIVRAAHRFEMLSTIEGEVVEVNPEVLRNPALAHDDPYSAGWRLAQHWMEESVNALHTRISPESLAYLQDGGHPIPDMLSLIPEPEWDNFVMEMLG